MSFIDFDAPAKTSGFVDFTKPKEEPADLARGFKTAFQQLPQLGYGLASIVAAGFETAAGEGGLATAAKNWASSGYKSWGDRIHAGARDSDEFDVAWGRAKEGDFGSLVDWLQYGVGYSIGQGIQILGTGGVGGAVGKLALKPAVETLAKGMVEKEASRLIAAGIAKDVAAKQAVSNVAVRAGAMAATGAQAFGMEGGEIGGDLVQANAGRELTGTELARAAGATALAGMFEFAGDALGLGAMMGKMPVGKTMAEMTGIKGRAARGIVGGAMVAPAEGATEYMQTGAEEWGKGKESTILPWDQSPEGQRQAMNAAALGALGGAVMGGAGGVVSAPRNPREAREQLDAAEAARTTEALRNIESADTVEAAVSAAGAGIETIPFSQTDVDLGKIEGHFNAQRQAEEVARAQEAAGAIPYERVGIIDSAMRPDPAKEAESALIRRDALAQQADAAVAESLATEDASQALADRQAREAELRGGTPPANPAMRLALERVTLARMEALERAKALAGQTPDQTAQPAQAAPEAAIAPVQTPEQQEPGAAPVSAATAAAPAESVAPAGPKMTKLPPAVTINGQSLDGMTVAQLQHYAENAPYRDQMEGAKAELAHRNRMGLTSDGQTVGQLTDKALDSLLANTGARRQLKMLAQAEKKRRNQVDADMVQRIQNPDVAEQLKVFAEEAGWAERGGHMIRVKTGERAGQEKISRTQWIPRTEWWPGRPVKESEDFYREAVALTLAGKPLSRKQKQVVHFLLGMTEDGRTGIDLPAETTAEELADVPAAVEAAGPAPDGWATMTEEEKDAELDKLFGPEPAAQPVAEREETRAGAVEAQVGPRDREPGEDDEVTDGSRSNDARDAVHGESATGRQGAAEQVASGALDVGENGSPGPAGAAQAQPEVDLEDRIYDLEAEAGKWFGGSSNQVIGERDFTAEWRDLVAVRDDDAAYADSLQKLLADHQAARTEQFAPMRDAEAESERARKESAVRGRALSAIESDFYGALKALDDSQLAALAKSLKVNGRGQRDTIIGGIDDLSHIDVAREYERLFPADRPALSLEQQTPADLKAKADAEAAAAKQKSDEEAAVESKRKADAEARAPLALTGSDRQADANPGQADLLSQPNPMVAAADALIQAAEAMKAAVQPAEKAKPELDPRKGDRFTDADGKTWEVWSQRGGRVEAFPVIDGKMKVNNRDGQFWSVTASAKERFPDARTDFNPVAKKKAEPTPQVASPGQLKTFIGIAADSIKELRKVDVERVLTSNPRIYQASIAAHIKENRPDLAQEVDDVLAEQGTVTPQTPTKPDAAEQTAVDYDASLDQTQTEAFKRWSNNAPLITAEQADAHQFKTGEKIVVEAFHGTKRPDRVGTKFQKKRATSGPMAFHTSDPALASSYAMGKEDTSLNYEDANYEAWFKFKPKGMRSAVDLDRAWYHLTPEQRASLAQTLPHVTDQTVDGDESNTLRVGEGDRDYGVASKEHWEYEIQQARGNVLQAAKEVWLNSGKLFGVEEEFMGVLRMAGFPMADLTFDSPNAAYPFVYKNYIAMQNPLVTNDIPANVTAALTAAAKRDRSRAQRGGDTWDKRNRTMREWVQEFAADPTKDKSYIWTSIPDKVTDVLRSLGYDGIVDWSGKAGGNLGVHPVYVPFEETQIKSAIGNKGTFSTDSKDILRQRQSSYNPNQLNLIYDDAETRPGTTDEQRSEGIAALKSLYRRDRGAGATLLASNLWRSFVARQGADLIGQQAGSARELGYLAQILRDPRFETLRFFFVKDGVVVGHSGVTSRLPGSVSFTNRAAGQETEETMTAAFDGRIGDLQAMMKNLGADGYYMLHNHPSGTSEPSYADEALTEKVAKRMDGFKGHVVINSKTFDVIDGTGSSESFPVKNEPKQPELAHDALGMHINKPADVVEVAKLIQRKDGYATIIAASSRGNVQAIAEIPEHLLSGATERDRLKAMVRVRRFAKMTGSGMGVFVVTENMDAKAFLIHNGVVTDVLQPGKRATLRSTVSPLRNREYKAGALRAEQMQWGRGRPQTTGRYETREELVREVWAWYDMPNTTQAQIARVTKVSEATVANILNDGRPAEPGAPPAFSRAKPVTYTTTKDGRPVLAGNGVEITDPAYWQQAFGSKVYTSKIVDPEVGHVGFVTLGWQDGRVAQLMHIEIAEEHRGNGYAERAVRSIIQHNGGAELHVMSILPEARGFWMKLGTDPFDTETGEDGILTEAAYDVARNGEGAARQGGEDALRQDAQRGDAGESQAPAGFRRDQGQALGFPEAEVRRLIAPILKGWANAPRVVVVGSMQDPRVPEDMRQLDAEQRAGGATGEPEGFIRGDTVYLVASALNSPYAVYRTLFHESLGHFGLRRVFGPELGRVLEDVARAMPERVAAKMREYGLKPSQRLQAAEEVLAELAQTRPQAGLVKRAIAAIRRFLRDLGIDLKLSDNDLIVNFILPARAFVEGRGAGAAAGSPVPAFGRDQTASEAFKKWFGDSKVVDADGEPLVVYHGTKADIAAFDDSETVAGFHFGSTASQAGMRVAGEGKNLMPVYLSIENPRRSKDRGGKWSSIIKSAKSAGHDGIVYLNRYEGIPRDAFERAIQAIAAKRGGNPDYVRLDELSDAEFKKLIPEAQESYIAFRPEQIKSAIGNRGTFDPANPDIAASRAPSPWYSDLSRAIEKVGMNAAPAKGWKDYIKGLAAKGVKADEIEWSGINDWLDLQGAKVTKGQVLDFLAENGVKVTEKMLGDGVREDATSEIDSLVVELDAKGYTVVAEPDNFGGDTVMAIERRSDGQEFDVTSDGSYSNEDALGVDDLPEDVRAIVVRLQAAEGRDFNSRTSADTGGTRYSQYTLPGGQNYRELLLTLPGPKVFESSHYPGVDNPLAHIRLNERTDADGKRVLFVEEFQSDWAQKGKREGFREKEVPHATRDELRRQLREELDANGRTPDAREIERELRAWETKTGAIPAAPFVGKTEAWVALAMRRMIRYAAEHGFDRVAWTTGAQQAARYDLSRQVKQIKAGRMDGGWALEMKTTEGRELYHTVHEDGKLADFVGKDLADKIIAEAKTREFKDGDGQRVKLEGVQLNVGGEGMIAFYDRIVPNVANDVLKKLGGGRVGVVHISGTGYASQGVRREGREWLAFDESADNAVVGRFDTREKAERFMGFKPRPQPGFDITDALRERALGGMPMFSRATGNAASWDSPMPSRMDSIIYAMQDKQIDTRRVLEQIRKHGSVADAQDVRLQEELYHGRTAKQVDDFLAQELKPLVTEMAARKVTMAEFEEYLHARHAEERNAQIAKINPEMPDGGSGMDTADARAYLSGLDPAKKRAYEALAKRVDAINAKTRQALVDYGLESQDTVDAWEQAYRHYVPLQREDMEGGPGTGQGFSVRGPASKRATGSSRSVVDILANVAAQREKAIVRGEKNRVAVALVGLAESNPNADFWRVDDPPTIKYVDDRTGLVTSAIDPLYKSRENVVMARVPAAGGEIVERSVIFNEHDERAMRMAAALKNLDMDDLGVVLGMSAKVTRYFAAVNTQYNPVFGVVNLMRDFQGAMVNLSSTELAGKQAEVSKNTLSALRGIYIDTRDTRQGKPATSAWAQLWEEFQTVGGKTGYRDMFRTSKDRGEAIEREIARVSEGKAKQFGRAVFDWLSDYNTAMENAVRLSAYKAGLDSGMTQERAASLAKNLTVNFNRKGQVATQAGALYAFFNASVQGTARLAETLAGPAGRKIIGAGMTLGVLQALLLAAAGFDDNEPPEFVRERNLIIPIGDKKYITIPMPLGLHVLPNVTRIASEFALSGFRDPGKRVAQLAGVFAEAFNPVGNAGLSLQTIAPTAIDPLAALAENRDWTGKPIAREDMNKLAPTPGHTRAKDVASAFSKAVSKGLNWMTGGTNYKPGFFSPTPDQIDYLIGQATGGVGREAMKAEQTITSAFTGDDLPTHKVPLLGRLYGNAEQQSSHANAFYANLKLLNEHEAEIKGRRKAGEPIGDYFRENPEARLFQMANKYERVVGELRRQKRALIEKDASRDYIKVIDLQITARMQQFNDQVKRARTAGT